MAAHASSERAVSLGANACASLPSRRTTLRPRARLSAALRPLVRRAAPAGRRDRRHRDSRPALARRAARRGALERPGATGEPLQLSTRPRLVLVASTHETVTRRFRDRLERLAGTSPVLQIGTHVQAAGTGRRVFCVTDCTIQHAFETGGAYQVGQLSPRVLAEAIAWQREVFEGCERIFVLSDWAGRSVIEHYGQAREKVSHDRRRRERPRRASCAPARSPLSGDPVRGTRLGAEGRPAPPRGVPPRARPRCPRRDWSWSVVGPPELEREPGVEVLGRLDRSVPAEEERLLDAYAAATCFCIAPSVDAFPNVLARGGGVRSTGRVDGRGESRRRRSWTSRRAPRPDRGIPMRSRLRCSSCCATPSSRRVRGAGRSARARALQLADGGARSSHGTWACSQPTARRELLRGTRLVWRRSPVVAALASLPERAQARLRALTDPLLGGSGRFAARGRAIRWSP